MSLTKKACKSGCACRSARRSGRHASTGAGLKPAALKALVHMNVEKTVERLTQVCVIFVMVLALWPLFQNAVSRAVLCTVWTLLC